MEAKCKLNAGNVKTYIDYHKEMGIPFKMTLTNYTTKIESELHKVHFMKNVQSNRTFSSFQKVKNDCLKKPCPKIDAHSCSYFRTNIFENNFYADTIYNIDLKAAYATVLFNDGYISKKTYQYIVRLPKMERLTCIGMMAGKKNVFQINRKGDVTRHESVTSPASGYFFHCVRRIEEIMNGARELLCESFLFSWVDGIYFLNKEEKKHNDLIDYFKKLNFKIKVEVLTEFHVELKDHHYKCSYIKEGKKKFINVPKETSSLVKSLSSYLLSS